MESYSSDPAIQTSGSGYPPTGYVSLIQNFIVKLAYYYFFNPASFVLKPDPDRAKISFTLPSD